MVLFAPIDEPFDIGAKMKSLHTDEVVFTEAMHLPVIKEYAKRIGLVDTINTMVATRMELQPGVAILGMVIDTLSGRSPLYRLTHFYEDKDAELLLGTPVEPELFSDYNLGRVLDKIYDTGTQKIFSQISVNAIDVFQIVARRLHFDTTSVSVYGDYDLADPPFQITYGHSKDKRPDLKQFLISMLCADYGVPLFGATKDGNASDKTLNNELLSNIGNHMKTYGLKAGAYVYVADSAFVTEGNLKKAEADKVHFLSRLPATYGQCGRAIGQAVEADPWTDIGTLATEKATAKRPHAHYRYFETTVTLYETPYRAIVVHSSAHDRRRHKRIDRLLTKEAKQLEGSCKKVCSKAFFCLPDAQAVAAQLKAEVSSSYHKVEFEIKEIPKFPRGRPAPGKKRVPDHYQYLIDATITPDPDKVAPLRMEAGCFVLITNIAKENDDWSGADLLSLYKEQNGIEKNFGFLKDPAIVNSIFLKKAERIEVLGLILLISLLIWRLMECSMRRYIKQNNTTITGWQNRPTKKPTSFMMTTKFTSVLLVKSYGRRALARPFKPVQLEYLDALNVSPEVFTTP